MLATELGKSLTLIKEENKGDTTEMEKMEAKTVQLERDGKR